MPDLSGKQLGQYELRELIGEGGMGAVYRGYQPTLKRDVAVKVISTKLAAAPDFVKRFTREAQIIAALEHPHIVPIYDYGTEGALTYIVMRHLTGGSLDDRMDHQIQTRRPLPSVQEVVDLVKQVADALDYAHARGVVHRDIKANNILFDQRGSAYVVDFGIARMTGATTGITGTGAAMGTPAYMAPEQWRGETATGAADQYALAVLTYQLLTNKLPFIAETPYALMMKHVFDAPTPINTIRSDLPLALVLVLERALSKDPEDRYPSVNDYARELEAAAREFTRPQQPTGYFITPLPPRERTADLRDVLNVVTPDVGTLPDEHGATTAPPPPDTRPEPSGGQGDAVPAQVSPSAGHAAPAPAPAPVGVPAPATLAAGGSVPTPPTRAPMAGLLNVAAVGVALVLLVYVLWQATGGINTPAPTLTPDAALTTQSGSATALAALPTDTRTPTATRTPSATPTATHTPTLDARAAALATRIVLQTLDAALTALAADDQTATATLWTATATPTTTPTATLTHTPSNTPPPRLTPRPPTGNQPGGGQPGGGGPAGTPPRIVPGTRMLVNAGDATLTIYAEPDANSAARGTLVSGDTVTVLTSPPLMVNGARWWEIETDDGVRGFVLENLNGVPTLIPLP